MKLVPQYATQSPDDVEAHVAAAIVNAENNEDDFFMDNIKV